MLLLNLIMSLNHTTFQIVLQIPFQKLKLIMSDSDAEMRQYAQSIIHNMKKAEETFALSPIEPNIPYQQCHLSKKLFSL